MANDDTNQWPCDVYLTKDIFYNKHKQHWHFRPLRVIIQKIVNILMTVKYYFLIQYSKHVSAYLTI